MMGWIGQRIGVKGNFFLFVDKEIPLSWYLHVIQFYITEIVFLIVLLNFVRFKVVVWGVLLGVVMQLFAFLGWRNDFPVYTIYAIPLIFILTHFKRGD